MAGRLQVIISTIEPGGGTGEEPYTHDSDEEVVVILAGVLDLWVADEHYVLREGDAITFPSRLPHWNMNRGDCAGDRAVLPDAAELLNQAVPCVLGPGRRDCKAAATGCMPAPDHPRRGDADHRPGNGRRRERQTRDTARSGPAHRDDMRQRPSYTHSSVAMAHRPSCPSPWPAPSWSSCRSPRSPTTPPPRHRRRRCGGDRPADGPADRPAIGGRGESHPDPDPDPVAGAHAGPHRDADPEPHRDPGPDPDAHDHDRRPRPITSVVLLPLRRPSTRQYRNYWCVPAATQTMWNLVLHLERTLPASRTLYRADPHAQPLPYATAGNDVQGWAWALRHYTGKPYTAQVATYSGRTRDPRDRRGDRPDRTSRSGSPSGTGRMPGSSSATRPGPAGHRPDQAPILGFYVIGPLGPGSSDPWKYKYYISLSTFRKVYTALPRGDPAVIWEEYVVVSD